MRRQACPTACLGWGHKSGAQARGMWGLARLELLGQGSHHRFSLGWPHRKPQKPSHSLETRKKPGGILRVTLGPAGERPEARAGDSALWGDLSQPPHPVHRSSIPSDLVPQTSCSRGQRQGACGSRDRLREALKWVPASPSAAAHCAQQAGGKPRGGHSLDPTALTPGNA